MKFVLSYSFGKDSTLCLHKMIEEGHTPVGLIVMVNEEAERSFFHGVDYDLMNRISEALEIPLLIGKTKGPDYAKVMESKLIEAKELGAGVAVFGDIDIMDHQTWCNDRCKEVGIDSYFPLWNKDREEIVSEIMELGYDCLIKAINNEKLNRSVLGKKISPELIDIFKEYKIDVCGEEGEYHTVVVGGPIFKHKVEYKLGDMLDFGVTSVIEID